MFKSITGDGKKIISFFIHLGKLESKMGPSFVEKWKLEALSRFCKKTNAELKIVSINSKLHVQIK